MNFTMKLHNDQISDLEFQKMEKTCNIAIAKLERALSYGPDMKSSRLSAMKDAKAVLSAMLADFDETKPLNR